MNKKLLKRYIAPSIALIAMSNVSLLAGSNISGEDEDSETIFTDGGDATGSIEGGCPPLVSGMLSAAYQKSVS